MLPCLLAGANVCGPQGLLTFMANIEAHMHEPCSRGWPPASFTTAMSVVDALEAFLWAFCCAHAPWKGMHMVYDLRVQP
jgi:hypothetical protein